MHELQVCCSVTAGSLHVLWVCVVPPDLPVHVVCGQIKPVCSFHRRHHTKGGQYAHSPQEHQQLSLLLLLLALLQLPPDMLVPATADGLL